MIACADLHIHSSYSFDGRMSLKTIVSAAKKKNINVVAICDHDNCDILSEIQSLADEKGLIDNVLVIPGIEVTTDSGHLLGLFLNRKVTPKENCKEMIKDIIDAGGMPVLAHPFQNAIGKANRLQLMQEGLVGVECFNARAESLRIRANEKATEAALKNNLIFTAGSDAHCKSEIGNGYIMLDVFEISLEEVKSALIERCGTISGVEAKRAPRGFSQITKRLKAKEYRYVPKRILVLIYFFITDLFRNRKKDISTIIGGQSYVDNN